MKVLQMLPSLEVGGVERGVIDLARAMKKRGDEMVVISSGGELVGELQKLGVPHYTLPVHKKSFFSLLLVSQIAEVIERERVEMVHARSRVPAWLGWLASRRTGVPFVTTCHGYYSTHFMSRIMGWGKRVIVISRIIGRHMIDDFGVDPERIRLIHRGVDLSQFFFRSLDTDPAIGSRNRPWRIINVGRFSPIKGQVEFLNAVRELRREFEHLEVWLVGSEGLGKHKYTDLLHETVRRLGLESCIKFLGTRRDIPSLLAQADLMVLSTLVPEAFGRVVVEAGAVGTPVVATRVGGVLDIIDDGENGLLVPAGDTGAMAAAIRDLLKDRNRAKQFAEKLREKVQTQFTLERMTDETMTVYREAKREKKILVIKLGAMGDLILGTPSFRMIRERFPEASLALLVDKNLAPLVASAPTLDEVIPIDRKKLSDPLYFFKVAKRLRQEGFDLAVDFQNSKWTHLLAFFAGIRERFGFRRGQFGFLLNRGERNFRVAEPPVQNQFRILSKLGVRKLEESLELWPEPESEERVERWMNQDGEKAGCKWVGLVIGSSPTWPTKRWPLEHFQKLTELLLREPQCRVVLIGSREDADFMKESSWRPSAAVLNLVGETSLMDLVSVVKRLDVLVTGDTAPLHVAGALKTKIVALFGPTTPARHMPPGNGGIVLTRNLSCQPCYQGTCKNPEKLACLVRIPVEEVYQAVKKQLVRDAPLVLK